MTVMGCVTATGVAHLGTATVPTTLEIGEIEMRTTGYTNPQIATLFASLDRDAPERTEGLDGSRMLFRHNVLFSHGFHFPLAVLDYDKGIALVRAREICAERSVSTRQHHDQAVRSLERYGWTIVYVATLDALGFHDVNLDMLAQWRDEYRAKAQRARTTHMADFWHENAILTAYSRNRFYTEYAEPGRGILDIREDRVPA